MNARNNANNRCTSKKFVFKGWLRTNRGWEYGAIIKLTRI